MKIAKGLYDVIFNNFKPKAKSHACTGRIPDYTEVMERLNWGRKDEQFEINKAFSQPIYESLEAMLGNSVNKYGSRRKIAELDASLSMNRFGFDGYARQVRDVQEGTKDFMVHGSTNKLGYHLLIDNDNIELLVEYKKDKNPEIFIFNRNNLNDRLHFRLAKDGSVNVVNSSGMTCGQALKVFEAYKPFLIKLKQNKNFKDLYKKDEDEEKNHALAAYLDEAQIMKEKMELKKRKNEREKYPKHVYTSPKQIKINFK